MTKEQNKKFFFILFEKLFNDSDYTDPYEFLIENFDPMIECSKCPLDPSICYNYKFSCFASLKEAIEKGDLIMEKGD